MKNVHRNVTFFAEGFRYLSVSASTVPLKANTFNPFQPGALQPNKSYSPSQWPIFQVLGVFQMFTISHNIRSVLFNKPPLHHLSYHNPNHWHHKYHNHCTDIRTFIITDINTITIYDTITDIKTITSMLFTDNKSNPKLSQSMTSTLSPTFIITMPAPTCTLLQLYPQCIRHQDAHSLQACKLPRPCICQSSSSPTSQNGNAELISLAETLSQKQRGFQLHDLRFLGSDFYSCLVDLGQIQPGGVTASLVCGPPQSQGPAPCSGKNFRPSSLLSQAMLQLTPANIAEGFVR